MNTITKQIGLCLVISLGLLGIISCGDGYQYREECNENKKVLTGGPGNTPRNVDHEKCPPPREEPDTGGFVDADTGVTKPDTKPNVDTGTGRDQDTGHTHDDGGGTKKGKCPNGFYQKGHRFVGIMLQLSNPDIPVNARDALILNSVDWVLPDDCKNPNILFVLDDNHHNEFYDGVKNEVKHIKSVVDRYRSYSTSYLDEPSNGVSYTDLKGYDAVWFSNPGYPVDDAKSVDALTKYVQEGGHLIVSGDDMSWSPKSDVSIGDLTGLSNPTNNNGVENCGYKTDNNKHESYQVDTISKYHPVIHGIRNRTFLYGNDIDHAYVANSDSEVLAWGGLPRELSPKGTPGTNTCRLMIPTVFVRNVSKGCVNVNIPDLPDIPKLPKTPKLPK